MSIGTAMWNGVSGLNAFSTATTVVSDNIANAGTTGFKANSPHFGDMVNTYIALQSDSVSSEGGGSSILGVGTNYAQGNLQPSSSWSDVAISGKGFFMVKEPIAGVTAASQTNYTRDGGFHLDASGYLVNLQGYRVQGFDAAGVAGDVQIANPQNYVSINVLGDGTINAVDNAGVSSTVGTIELADFAYEGGLVRQGGNLYIAGPELTGATVFLRSTTPAIFGRISAYNLEGSNVDMAKEMVNLIIYQADYNANSKSITTSRDMIETAINLAR